MIEPGWNTNREIKQLFNAETYTSRYLLINAASKEAAIIDSVKEQFTRDSQYIRELGLTLKPSFETYIHADYVTASGLLRSALGSKAVVRKNIASKCSGILIDEGSEFTLGARQLKFYIRPDTQMPMFV